MALNGSLTRVKELLGREDSILFIGPKEPVDYQEGSSQLLDVLQQVVPNAKAQVYSLASVVKYASEKYTFYEKVKFLPVSEFLVESAQRKGYDGKTLLFLSFYRNQLQRLVNNCKNYGGKVMAVSLDRDPIEGADLCLADRHLSYGEWIDALKGLA